MIQRFFRTTAGEGNEPRPVRAEHQVVAVFLAGLFFGFAFGLKVAAHDETRVAAAELRMGWGELPESRELLLAVTEGEAEEVDDQEEPGAEAEHTGGE